MPFYTIIAEYDEGTYVAQVNADDIHQAISIWAANFDTETGLQISDELQREQEEDCEPVLLNGLSNIWCEILFIRDELMLIHIIQTVVA